MAILIRILLLTIVVFQNSDESHAMNNKRSSSESSREYVQQPLLKVARPIGRPHGSKRGTFRNRYIRHPPVEGPPNGSFQYMGYDMNFWLYPDQTMVQKVDYEKNILPDASFYRYNNFLLRLSPRMIENRFKFVEYIYQNGTLMGVRAAAPTNANIMEPDDTTWFIVYDNNYFRLTVDPIVSEPVGIEHLNECQYKEAHIGDDVEVAGVKFEVFRGGPKSVITGAKLLKKPALPVLLHNLHARASSSKTL